MVGMYICVFYMCTSARLLQRRFALITTWWEEAEWE